VLDYVFVGLYMFLAVKRKQSDSATYLTCFQHTMCALVNVVVSASADDKTQD